MSELLGLHVVGQAVPQARPEVESGVLTELFSPENPLTEPSDIATYSREVCGHITARELIPDELRRLRAAPRDGTAIQTPTISEMKARHHALAMRLATGAKPVDVSREMGISTSRISILMHSPAFADLLAHYIEEAKERQFDMMQRMQLTAMTLLEHIEERVESLGPVLPLDELHEMFKTLADRVGYSPVHKIISAHVGPLSVAEIETMKREAAHAREALVILEGSAGAVAEASTNQEVAVGEPDNRSRGRGLPQVEQEAELHGAAWPQVREDSGVLARKEQARRVLGDQGAMVAVQG